MSRPLEINDTLLKIMAAKSSDAFKHYIDYIRFPRFKNIVDNTRIDFASPFTVFIGQNGSGKSSTLHALYGAPEGYSTGNFWFSTTVDPILEGEENPNCFVYGYRLNNVNVEVLKTRIKRDNPDYWEPSRPLKKYGMTLLGRGKRHPTIKKDVVYLDFRSELSAFDKYFYFLPFRSTITLKTKQDVIRKYSKFLRRIIDHDELILYRNKVKNKKPITLNQEALQAISRILSKDYSYCKLIYHSLFVHDGLSVYFKTTGKNYSEAFAGRGEFAVAKIVHEVLEAPKYALIILDEPEVSLHPGAQEELKLFLLQQVLKKQLQVIISTHSPKFAENLPEDAVKLFYEDATGQFSVKNRCNPIEAFQSIGINIPESDKNLIIVEDIIAKTLIGAILKEMGKEYELLFDVRYYPGGSEQLLKKATGYSEEEEKHKFLLLDGDKKTNNIDPSLFSAKDSSNIQFIKEKVKERSNIDFDKMGFRFNSNTIDSEKISTGIKYLEFLEKNLKFLPKKSPEELIWNEDYAKKLLEVSGHTDTEFTSDYKQNILQFTEIHFGDKQSSSHISAIKLLTNEFCNLKNTNYNFIVETIKEMKSSVS